MIIGKVDGDSNRKLSQKFSIKGFPTLLWFSENSSDPIPYEGPRDLDSLSKFITEKTRIKSKVTKETTAKVAVQLTDKNFEDIVMDKHKNVLVEL